MRVKSLSLKILEPATWPSTDVDILLKDPNT